ncbi:uncharacterized protein FIBRA_06723 [Fibroporia radiculosa]|uniref:Uncharacterized protein n=1 Tax=Fibroporia radiculosa TaxID=599839 RepID=J4HZJ8_9APHY|nr:uncharacterized protein FIBRA_06723 [Fibroporia radiculosa]CCM04542.1 predicted protein [Fibroporia radiculosa]
MGRAQRKRAEGQDTKKPKQFLTSDAALKLAESISETQESVSHKKVERHQQLAHIVAEKSKNKAAKSRQPNTKLKEAKAVAIAAAARAKKEKANSRKQAKIAITSKAHRSVDEAGDGMKHVSKPVKHVSFA